MSPYAQKLMTALGIPEAYRFWVLAGVFLVYAGVAMGFGSLFAGVCSWYERRIAARMQSRIGPNRVGPQGILQWLADGMKCFLKEDLIPQEADPPLFRLAPYPVFIGVASTFVVLPFSATIVGSDLNVGLVYLIAITALVVAGILMAGWSSNSKWTLLGGIRSAAQMISYEIPLALALLVVVVPAGTLSLQEMIRQQGGAPWNWFVFQSPFTFIAFFVYFTSALAEGNRTPFDLPEAESELVAGYNTEYSGMRFLFFFFAEWMNLYVVGAIATAVFFGGWRIPCIPWDRQAGNILLEFVGFVLFLVKSLTLVNVIIWLRWTLPRLRIDQLMKMCWKYFVPIGMVSLVGSMLFTALVHAVPLVGRLTSYGLFGLGVLICAVFAWRAAYALRTFPAKPYLRWMV